MLDLYLENCIGIYTLSRNKKIFCVTVLPFRIFGKIFSLDSTSAIVYAPTEKDKMIRLVAFRHLVNYFGAYFAVNYTVAVYASEIVE